MMLSVINELLQHCDYPNISWYKMSYQRQMEEHVKGKQISGYAPPPSQQLLEIQPTVFFLLSNKKKLAQGESQKAGVQNGTLYDAFKASIKET